jgi:hypothetical protein
MRLRLSAKRHRDKIGVAPLSIRPSLKDEQTFVRRHDVTRLQAVVIENPFGRQTFVILPAPGILQYSPPLLDRHLLGTSLGFCNPFAPFFSADARWRIVLKDGIPESVLGKAISPETNEGKPQPEKQSLNEANLIPILHIDREIPSYPPNRETKPQREQSNT